MSQNPAAICGQCGNRYSKHFFEGDEIFCYRLTNGDCWTEDPCDDLLVAFLKRTQPELIRQARLDWMRANGHAVET